MVKDIVRIIVKDMVMSKDFGFTMVLSWFLLVRMENKLAGLTEVIGELSCNIAALRGETPKK